MAGKRSHSSAPSQSAFDRRSQAGGAYDVVHAQDNLTANAVPRCVRTVHRLDAFSTADLVQCHEKGLRSPYAHVCVSQAVAAAAHQGLYRSLLTVDRVGTGQPERP